MIRSDKLYPGVSQVLNGSLHHATITTALVSLLQSNKQMIRLKRHCFNGNLKILIKATFFLMAARYPQYCRQNQVNADIKSGLAFLTLLGTSAVHTGPSVGCVLGVPGGSTVPRPIKIIVFVLSEHADGLLLETAVELSCERQSRATLKLTAGHKRGEK